MYHRQIQLDTRNFHWFGLMWSDAVIGHTPRDCLGFSGTDTRNRKSKWIFFINQILFLNVMCTKRWASTRDSVYVYISGDVLSASSSRRDVWVMYGGEILLPKHLRKCCPNLLSPNLFITWSIFGPKILSRKWLVEYRWWSVHQQMTCRESRWFQFKARLQYLNNTKT